MVFTFVIIIRHVVILRIASSQRNASPRHNGHGSLHGGMCGGHGVILHNIDDEDEYEYDGTSIVQW